MKQEKLFEQFPPVSSKEWLDKINQDLKGADFNKKLVWKTGEGFEAMPFYRAEDLEQLKLKDFFLPLFLRNAAGNGNKEASPQSWLIRQNIITPGYGEANQKAHHVLMNGIDSLGFKISDPESVNKENFVLLLKDIVPECVEINFMPEGRAREIIAVTAEIWSENGFDLSRIRGAVETDPLGRLMLNGTLCIPVESAIDYLASLVKETQVLPSFRTIQVNGSNFTNSGSDAVSELAFSISMAVEYMDLLTGKGIDPGVAAHCIRFGFGIGSSYFIEIAKLRAARLLWHSVCEKYGVSNEDSSGMEIHCTTGTWNATVYDPYVNMLRTQTEAMSAVLGGADSITVNPFNTAFSNADEFAERIARNQQLILREEAYFDKVADPSAGSYYIENLTSMVAGRSWELFLETERAGGFLAALKSGVIQKKISERAEKRKKDIGTRKEILLGTNQFPNTGERVTDDKIIRMSSEVTDRNDLLCEPVKPSRGAEDLENIRSAVDLAPRKPVVFLLSIGNPVLRRARAQFSAGFFGCAGYKIEDNDGFSSVDEGVEAALKQNADIVVICSSDEEYPAFAPEIFGRLNGRAMVVVAGNPLCTDDLKKAGIENFISIRSDLVDTLRHYNSLLGIK